MKQLYVASISLEDYPQGKTVSAIRSRLNEVLSEFDSKTVQAVKQIVINSREVLRDESSREEDARSEKV